MVPDCWACELARGTPEQFWPEGAPESWKPRWYYLKPGVGIVCKDMHEKQWAMRLLYVPIHHDPCGKEPQWQHERAKALLTGVVAVCLPDFEVLRFDLIDHTYREHWHAQVCLGDK